LYLAFGIYTKGFFVNEKNLQATKQMKRRYFMEMIMETKDNKGGKV